MGNATVVGGARAVEPVTFKANFADNDWATIIKACQKNKVPETWVVGDKKTMTINGTDYAIDIIGKNHDTYSDGSGTAPLTFQMHDCYGTTYAMNSSRTNVGGWDSCVMRKTHLPSILALMPSEVQVGIKEVNKKASAGSKSKTIKTSADKLFLLSEIEVRGSITGSFSVAGEGSQYDYYKAGNSRIKYSNGSAVDWWFRSPYPTTDQSFAYWMTNNSINAAWADSKHYVAFAFCF